MSRAADVPAAPRPSRRRSDRDPLHDDAPAPGKPARRRTDREPTGERRQQRARDPEARRRALAVAALEVISESGIGRTTHRAVAARADLPLGATTYYFPTLDDLIAAGLQLAAADQQADLAIWAERLRGTDDVPAAVAGLIAEYVTDRQRAQMECELYVAAGRDPALRPLATAWLTGMHDLLEPHFGAAATRDLVALFDGVTLQALITGRDVDAGALTATIRRLTAAR
ncbi:TetR/AcrR family transcriptional regulator [Actinoplanes sp. URMC 104]|uniref:TetR/AcrR family transcriptional regulator n=1 Tax=Actinoplanes sp. URMC 104 TaxID=3423409 RepID=UPI003F19EE16